MNLFPVALLSPATAATRYSEARSLRRAEMKQDLARLSLRRLCIVATLLLIVGCMTPAQRQARELQMQQYRAQANQFFVKADVQNMLRLAAREDPEFERVYVARAKDQLDKRNVVNPRVQTTLRPTYPLQMRWEWREADLYFAVLVGKDGKIASTRYLPLPELLISEQFIFAAKEALEKWEFESGSVDGMSEEFVLIVPVRFRLT